MVLFSREDGADAGQQLSQPLKSISAGTLAAPGTALMTAAGLKQLSSEISKSASLIFLSEGNLSFHHLLCAILDECGPADVWLSAYAITEEPARRIFRLREAGTIRSLSCLLDAHLARNNAKAYQLLSTTADSFGTAPIHAKCFVVKNDRFAIGVMSSANFSNNPRLELTHTSNTLEVADWYIKWLEDYISKGKVK